LTACFVAKRLPALPSVYRRRSTPIVGANAYAVQAYRLPHPPR
jgi:hypothetical protein